MSQIITATLTLCNDDDPGFETTVVLKGTREQLDNTTIFDKPEYAGLYIADVDYEPNLWRMYAPGGIPCRLVKETPLYCIYEYQPFIVPGRFTFQAAPALIQHRDAGWGRILRNLGGSRGKRLGRGPRQHRRHEAYNRIPGKVPAVTPPNPPPRLITVRTQRPRIEKDPRGLGRRVFLGGCTILDRRVILQIHN